jgi:kumamolisin
MNQPRKTRHPVAGSEREPMPGARMIGAADPHERVQVTLLLRRANGSKAIEGSDHAGTALHARKYMTHEQFEAAHGASAADIAAVQSFAAEHDLDIVGVHPEQRRIVLSGTVASVSTAFGVYLAKYEHPGGQYRGRVGEVLVPEDLADIVEGVFGLDDRPQAKPHNRRANGNGGGQPLSPLDVARLYDFPTDATGKGQCIGIIELGGGYRSKDLTAYFSQLGVPKPRVTSISVDGGHNQATGDPNGPDGEVMLDIEVAGAVAPNAHIAVYFAANTDAGFLDAIKTAVHDTSNKPSVISISWGAAEAQWTQQAMQAMDGAFQDAAALGVTICVAAGDDGSADGVSDGQAHVDFPASSPNVLACGGTRLIGSGTQITSEIVWNDGQGHGATGGGISAVFALPSWQSSIVTTSVNPGNQTGRGVPDVAGNADPVTGYEVRVDGQPAVIGGTSAVAPLWAGLIAQLNEKLPQPAGFLNPLLYGLPASSSAFHAITVGDNGDYKAAPGWNACTGLGSPDGQQLYTALSTMH